MTKNNMPISARRKITGAAAVEFALVLPILLLIVAGIVEFGRAFWFYDVLTKATRDGARYMASVAKENIGTATGNASNPPYNATTNFLTVRSVVVNAATAAGVSPALDNGSITVVCLDSSFGVVACQNNTAPAYVRVAINYNKIVLGEFLPLSFVAGATSLAVSLVPGTTMRYMK